jgi:hypothetical protein
MKNKLYLFILALVLMTGCHHHAQKPTTNNPVLGSWQLQSVKWISTERTAQIEQAQPGLFMFDEGHYSLMWSPKQTPRTPFENLSKPTDEEILNGFRSIVFNAGTYQISGSKLDATAMVAKVPGFEGGQQHYTFRFENGLLKLTMYDETYPDGSKPDWSGKWQTEFTLIKAE